MYTLEEAIKKMNSEHQTNRCVLWEVFDNGDEWIFMYGDYIKEGYLLMKVATFFDKKTGKETVVHPPKIYEYDFEKMKVLYARKITVEEAIAIINEFYLNCEPPYATKKDAVYEDDNNYYFLLENELFRYKFYVLVGKSSRDETQRKLTDEEVRMINPNLFKKVNIK